MRKLLLFFSQVYKKTRIRQKLLLTFIILSLFVAAVSYSDIVTLTNIKTDIHQLRKSSIVELNHTAEMVFEFFKIQDILKEYMSVDENSHPDQKKEIIAALREHFKNFEIKLNARKEITTASLMLYKDKELDEEKEELNNLSGIESKYHLFRDRFLHYSGENRMPAGNTSKRSYVLNWQEEGDILFNDLLLLQQKAQEEIVEETFEIEHAVEKASSFQILIAVICCILAVSAGIFIAKTIVEPIRRLNEAVQHTAQGNMNSLIPVTSHDEIGNLTVSFNKMITELKKTHEEIESNNRQLEEKVGLRTKELNEYILKLQQTEEQLKALVNKLKNSNQELEQFAYVASHDLQEPLRTISSFALLLKNQYMGKFDEKADEYFDHLLGSANRMGVLINDLLDYSRLGKKKEKQQVDCNAVLAETISDLTLMIKEVGAKIIYDTLPVVSGYPSELKLLFQNLIINAIKFRKNDVSPVIMIEARENDKHWEFVVSDNGIGIDKKYQQKIFIIFQRLHNRNKYEGSGIGLAHCKKIVEIHGGSIWVESDSGMGAAFHFLISKEK